jgi:hypothetical protein
MLDNIQKFIIFAKWSEEETSSAGVQLVRNISINGNNYESSEILLSFLTNYYLFFINYFCYLCLKKLNDFLFIFPFSVEPIQSNNVYRMPFK